MLDIKDTKNDKHREHAMALFDLKDSSKLSRETREEIAYGLYEDEQEYISSGLFNRAILLLEKALKERYPKRYEIFKTHLMHPELSQSELAEMFNVSQPYISRDIKLAQEILTNYMNGAESDKEEIEDLQNEYNNSRDYIHLLEEEISELSDVVSTSYESVKQDGLVVHSEYINMYTDKFKQNKRVYKNHKKAMKA